MAFKGKPEKGDWNIDISCDSFISDSTSSGAAGDFVCKKKRSKVEGSSSRSTPPISTSSSSLSQIRFQPFDSECLLLGPQIRKTPDVKYELNIAKSILQQYSTLSGLNLYEHLSDIIKRVLDERPPNVIDFFEEFSRNVREQKFHLPERFPPSSVFEETRIYKAAKKQLQSMRLYYDQYQIPQAEASLEIPKSEESMEELAIGLPRHMFNIFTERIQQLQFYWNQCGFSISTDDIFLLAASIDRLQTHPDIQGCRFWGVINGLRASYYIVEAVLTREHIRKRLQQMEDELREKFQSQLRRERCMPSIPTHIGPELTPGFYGWENYPKEELEQMQPKAAPIPLPRIEESYDIPPEMIGSGLNRFSYFVVNSLTEDWLELPVVTPKQIVISRQMKKFFTGDLEAEICSYPCFPGKEKHYLRAMIARITCGTTIAPKGYYRKMTRYERCLYEGDEDEECEEEDDEDRSDDDEEDDDDNGEDGEEAGEIDNDILPLRNKKYKDRPLEDLTQSCKWVHVRPNVLKQGRVVWFDEMRARKEREKELARLRKLEFAEEIEDEEESDDEQYTEDDAEEEQSLEDRQEYGPNIFSDCSTDFSDEFTVPWVSRFTSHFINKVERVLVMRSNVWPGSYTFTFDKVCETIYMGWGQKYVSRNMPFQHLPQIVDEYPHNKNDFIETNDPTVAEEKCYCGCQKNGLKSNIEFADLEDIYEDNDEDDDHLC